MKPKDLELEKMERIYLEIFDALGGLKSFDAIALLECAKQDIILQSGSIKLDGSIGTITKKKE